MKVLFQLLIAVFFFLTSLTAQTYSSSAPAPKQITSAALEEMKNFNNFTKSKSKKDIENVIKNVGNSLKTELWLDDSRLMPEAGEAVFVEHKLAVKALEKLAKNNPELSEISFWMNSLIVADQTINITLFQDMEAGFDQAGCGEGDIICVENAQYYHQAEKYHASALEEIANGRNERAIDDFKQAWNTLGQMVILSLTKDAANQPAAVTPKAFEVQQNYPNPFNPSTSIRFALPSNAVVTVKVYNAIGQEVATLVNGLLEAGYHETNFNASALASGLYIYRIEAASQTGEKFVHSNKMLLMK